MFEMRRHATKKLRELVLFLTVAAIALQLFNMLVYSISFVDDAPSVLEKTMIDKSPLGERTLSDEFRLARKVADETDYRPKRLQLVFHVGPRKTATTTIQTDFTTFQDKQIFEQDGWEYMGRLCHPHLSKSGGKMVYNCRWSRLLELGRKAMKPCADNRQKICVNKQFLEELDVQYARGKNLVLSDESWGSSKWGSRAHYEALRDAIPSDKWEVTIITGYRRFFEWLPSDMFQNARLDHTMQTWHEVWPPEGQEIEGVFPNVYKKWYHGGDHVFTDWVVECVGDTFPLKILDIHDKTTGVRTNLVCNMMDMPNACRFSRELDKEGNHTYMNSHDSALHVFFDTITFRAAKRGWVDTSKYERPVVREALAKFTEDILKLTPVELDRDCPSESQLEEHLQESLRVERRVFGDKIALQREVDTREAFQTRVDDKFFCGVDAEAVLNRNEFRTFFQKYH